MTGDNNSVLLTIAGSSLPMTAVTKLQGSGARLLTPHPDTIPPTITLVTTLAPVLGNPQFIEKEKLGWKILKRHPFLI